MFINEVSIDRYLNGKTNFDICEDISFEEIKNLIKQLNGVERTIVYLSVDGMEQEKWMAIAGGLDNKYLVTGNIDWDTPFTLIDENCSNPCKSIELMIEGIIGDYEERILNNLEPVLQAAESFALYGLLDKSLNWEILNWKEEIT